LPEPSTTCAHQLYGGQRRQLSAFDFEIAPASAFPLGPGKP